MPAVFVTSTGTEIGKTFVTAGLIRHFRNAGRAVAAIKPIVSGFDPDAAAGSDPGLLLEALGRAVTPEEIARISPWRFTAGVAPALAAKREGRVIDFRALVDFSQRAMGGRERLLIEGVGGVMVPLDDRHTVIDWISALRVPVIVVVGSYLGTISHTLTALHVLAQRNLSTIAVVVSETPGSPVPLDETAGSISRFAGIIDVIALPRTADGAQTGLAFNALAALL
ncbi:MAG TPA: dethiobiotin synthase [Xanthobacteraceae bacterium]|nr:dethiobiotin synthase [Xanthobacteraceae bacterium]